MKIETLAIEGFPLFPSKWDNLPLLELHKKIQKVNFENTKDLLFENHDMTPCIFVYTKDNLWYIELNLKIANATKSSPLDQIEPLINHMKNNPKHFGDIMSYQMIGEAWAKKFAKDMNLEHIAYGDISKMASSIELLMEAIVNENENIKFNMYEMVREENTGNIIEFIQNPEHSDVFQTTKFPPIGRSV